MVPLLLHKEIINFYYDKLYHSGFTRIHKTVNANFQQPSLCMNIECFTSECNIYARLKKRTGTRYRRLTLKDTSQETIPQDMIIINSISLWSF